MDYTHFLNGKLVSSDRLLISPMDLGYTRGYSVFEFMMTSKERPFMLERHIERLFQSCESISLQLPWSKEQIGQWALQTYNANEHIVGEKVMRLTISGGPTWTLSPAKIPTIVIVVESRIKRPAEDYNNGVHVVLSEFQRYVPEAKTSNYIEAVRKFASLPSDIDEVIYHSEGMVLEGTRCNVFAVINGVITTPQSKVLSGITRGIILNDLKLPFSTIEKDFSVEELLNASEIFITATSKNIMPVTKINGSPVGKGLVGPITKEVMSTFQNFFNKGDW